MIELKVRKGVTLMSYVFPFKERGLPMVKYFSKPNAPRLAKAATVALEKQYRSRYEKEAKTYKLYDGKMGDVTFPILKKMSVRFPRNKQIRQAMKDAIRDKQLTKAFYKPSLLFKTLEGFYSPDRRNRDNDPHYQAALQRVREMIVPDKPLKPRLIKKGMNVRKNLTTLNTSAGISNYGKKKKHVINHMITEGLEIKRQIASGKSFFKISVMPYIAITRSQLGTLASNYNYVRPTNEDGTVKYKGRLVWCLDAVMVLIESQFARPLINHLARNWPNIAMGKSPEYLRSMLCDMSEVMLQWSSTDYSKYDSTVPAFLIRDCFDIIKECFDVQYHREIDFICQKFIHADILMPDMNVYSVSKGIKSGSYFTQVVGSMCNAIIMLTFLEHKYNKHDPEVYGQPDLKEQRNIDTVFRLPDGRYAFSALGDDNAFAINDQIDYNAFKSYVYKVFGMIVNVDKSSYGKRGEPIEYLRRFWTRMGEWRDPADLMINILHPERARKYDNYSPWHILFGYYVTYRVAMEEMGFSASMIVSEMKKTPFGINALDNVEREELPGALASIRHTDYDLYRAIVDDAIALAESDYAARWEDAVA